jgi:hypothetical protein
MAKTIGQLTQTTTLASGDEFVIEQSGLTKRVAASVVRGGLIDANIDAAAAIAGSKLADDAITTAKIDDDAVTTAKIDNDAVTTAKIDDGAITAAKLDGAQTGSAPIYGCRAWVNFDGTRDEADTGASTNGANVLIRASGNVASVLKNATGDYTITFTTAMPNANYIHVAPSVGQASASYNWSVRRNTQTASAFGVIVNNSNAGTSVDSSHVSVAFFG